MARGFWSLRFCEFVIRTDTSVCYCIFFIFSKQKLGLICVCVVFLTYKVFEKFGMSGFCALKMHLG